eukprot:scaffold110154_cov15-Tisochrysis_lutea.AAC.1
MASHKLPFLQQSCNHVHAQGTLDTVARSLPTQYRLPSDARLSQIRSQTINHPPGLGFGQTGPAVLIVTSLVDMPWVNKAQGQ